MITLTTGSFQKTINAAEYSVRNQIKTELHFVPFPSNYHKLPELAILAEGMGVSKISVLRFVPQGRGKGQSQLLLTRHQNLELRKSILSLREDGYNIRTGSPYNFLMLNDQPACCAGIDRLCIAPDMRITPCDGFKQITAQDIVGTEAYSQLKSYSLQECWDNSPYLGAIREYLTTPFAERCKGCEELEKCLSGCLAQKYVEYGGLEKNPDPLCLYQS